MKPNRLKQTVNLVEERVKNDKSVDPMKDLTFLSEHYRTNHEWEKASAATRHMLAIAEGDSSSRFEITPIDIELHKHKPQARGPKPFRFVAAGLIVGMMAVALPLSAVNVVTYYKKNPKPILDAMTHLFPHDPQVFVQRAYYQYERANINKALADCNTALAIDPANSNALQEKSFILIDAEDLQEAWVLNEASLHTGIYFYNKATIEFARGDHASAIVSMKKGESIAPRSDATRFRSYIYALSGDFEQALRVAELETSAAKNDHERSKGYADQARYLLHLGRYDQATKAASYAIGLGRRMNARSFALDNALSSPLPSAYTFRAEAEYELGSYKRAVDDATRALVLDSYGHYIDRAFKVRAKSFDAMGFKEKSQLDLQAAATWKKGGEL